MSPTRHAWRADLFRTDPLTERKENMTEKAIAVPYAPLKSWLSTTGRHSPRTHITIAPDGMYVTTAVDAGLYLPRIDQPTQDTIQGTVSGQELKDALPALTKAAQQSGLAIETDLAGSRLRFSGGGMVGKWVTMDLTVKDWERWQDPRSHEDVVDLTHLLPLLPPLLHATSKADGRYAISGVCVVPGGVFTTDGHQGASHRFPVSLPQGTEHVILDSGEVRSAAAIAQCVKRSESTLTLRPLAQGSDAYIVVDLPDGGKASWRADLSGTANPPPYFDVADPYYDVVDMEKDKSGSTWKAVIDPRQVVKDWSASALKQVVNDEKETPVRLHITPDPLRLVGLSTYTGSTLPPVTIQETLSDEESQLAAMPAIGFDARLFLSQCRILADMGETKASVVFRRSDRGRPLPAMFRSSEHPHYLGLLMPLSDPK